MSDTQPPELMVFAVFVSILKTRFPDQSAELSQVGFTVFNGAVYMWYEPGSPWFSQLGQKGFLKTENEIKSAWNAAIDSQPSVPWRSLYILPNN